MSVGSRGGEVLGFGGGARLHGEQVISPPTNLVSLSVQHQLGFESHVGGCQYAPFRYVNSFQCVYTELLKGLDEVSQAVLPLATLSGLPRRSGSPTRFRSGQD